MWKELKSKLSSQYSSIPFDSHATKAFAHYNKVQMNYLKCFYTMQVYVSFYRKFTTCQTSLRF